jgi:hypothetical protein
VYRVAHIHIPHTQKFHGLDDLEILPTPRAHARTHVSSSPSALLGAQCCASAAFIAGIVRHASVETNAIPRLSVCHGESDRESE